MKIFKKYFLNVVLIGILSFLSVYFTLQGNFIDIINVLKELSIFSLMILIVIGMLPLFIEAKILQNFSKLYLPTYTYKNGFINAMTGSFFSGITPFSSGGQFAQAYVYKKQGISYTNSTGILLMHFIVYQLVLVIYTMIIMIFKYQEMAGVYQGFLSLALLGFMINTCVIVGLLLGAISHTFQYFLTNTVLKVARYCHVVKDYESAKDKLENYLTDFQTELKVIKKNPKEMMIISLLFVLKLTILYSLPFLVQTALKAAIDFSLFFDYFSVCAFVYLITAFIPIPGASGGSEGCYVLLYTTLMGSVLAKSSMLVWRFITYYWIIFLGSIVFLSFTSHISNKKGEYS